MARKETSYTDSRDRANALKKKQEKKEEAQSPSLVLKPEKETRGRILSKALLVFAIITLFGAGLGIHAGRQQPIPTQEHSQCFQKIEPEKARCASIEELAHLKELINQGFRGFVTINIFTSSKSDKPFITRFSFSASQPKQAIEQVESIATSLQELQVSEGMAYYLLLSLEEEYPNQQTPYGKKDVAVESNFFAISAHFHELGKDRHSWDHFSISQWTVIRLKNQSSPYFASRIFIIRPESLGLGFPSGIFVTYPFLSSESHMTPISGKDLGKFSELMTYLRKPGDILYSTDFLAKEASK